MVSESDHRSLKARGCLSSIIATHSHDHHHVFDLQFGFALPMCCIVGRRFRFCFPHPSISSCSSPSHSSPSSSKSSSCICLSSSSEEESSVQPRRWWVSSSAMQYTSWGMHGTKFANATTILSSAQLRLFATPQVGTHSTSSLPGLYARMLPSKMRARTMHR